MITPANMGSFPAAPLPGMPKFVDARRATWTSVTTMFSLRRQRRSLARLSDHLLRDVGITPSQAHLEANRKAWDVPSNWRR